MVLHLGSRQWWVRLVAVIVGMGVVVGSNGPAASAGPVQKSTVRQSVSDPAIVDHASPVAWTLNLSGSSRNNGNIDALAEFKFVLAHQAEAGRLPLAIGIQEACEDQSNELLSFLQTVLNENYTMARWNSRTGFRGCGSRPQSYGNAIYVFAGTVVAQKAFDAQQPDPGVSFDNRGFVCMRSAFPYTACTAHLICPRSCGDPDQAAEIRFIQFREYFNAVLEFADNTSSPVYWGGDLYISPSEMEASHPNALLFGKEADECGADPDWQSTQDDGGKADWLFLSPPVASEDCIHDASVAPMVKQDHHLLGSFHVPQWG